MLPLTIQKRLASPGKLENEFLNFLRKANAPIDQSKTIAYQVLTDSKLTGGQNNVEFFTGDFVQNRTNIDGSYIRPSSEHFLIYGIRGYYVDEIPPGSDINFNVPLRRGFTTLDAFNDQQAPALSQAQMSINVNSVRLNKYIPLTEFDNQETAGSRGTMFLDQPILWQGQTELKLVVETADPSILFNDNSAMRFDVFGLGLI